MEDKLTKLVQERSLNMPPDPKDDSALEHIKAYLDDHTGKFQLKPEFQEIFKRWRQIYNFRMDGKTVPQVISAIRKMFDVSERTVRWDLKYYPKAFRLDFDADFELRILYHKAEQAFQKYNAITNPKYAAIAQKYLKLMREIAADLKLENPLLDPNMYRQTTLIVTTNPKDIGIEDEIPDIDHLMREYAVRGKKVDNAETIDFEDAK